MTAKKSTTRTHAHLTASNDANASHQGATTMKSKKPSTPTHAPLEEGAPIMTHVEAAPTAPPPPPPPAIDFAAIRTALGAITAALGPNPTALSIDERQRLVKVKAGGLDHVDAVMTAFQDHGFVIPEVDPARVAADLSLIKELAPICQELEVIDTLLADRSRAAQSRVWKATTLAYSTLTHYVPSRPNLQVQLAPMASFLAVRFKDAPTSLRQKEKKALQKARSTRKAKKEAAPPKEVPPSDAGGAHEAPPAQGTGTPPASS